MDPVTIGLSVANGVSNLLSGGAQRKAQQRQYDQGMQQDQRDSATQQAQFAANLGFNRDQDQFNRAKDVYAVGRDQEADAYRRAQTNATNPARRDLIAALMARLTGGGNGQPMQGAAVRPGNYAPMPRNGPQMPPGASPAAQPPSGMGNPVPSPLAGFQPTFNPAQLSGQAPVTARPNYDAVAQSAAKPYTVIENPLAKEAGLQTAQYDQEAQKRAEGSIENKLNQFKRGERDKADYERRVGFDIDDPANRERWLKLFLADDSAYQKAQNDVAGQSARSVGVRSY